MEQTAADRTKQQAAHPMEREAHPIEQPKGNSITNGSASENPTPENLTPQNLNPIETILRENEARNRANQAPFNPITGEGAILERVPLRIADFAIPVQYVPTDMMRVPLVRQLQEAGSIRSFITRTLRIPYTDADRERVVEHLVRARMKHDFCFWAAYLVMIKNKDGGDDIHFRLNRPQRRLVTEFERARLQGRPIRLILLKARQWGGSTATQIYMAWLQLVHLTGLNSLIISLQTKASDEILDMYGRMIKTYPVAMLHPPGEPCRDNEPKWAGVGASGAIHRVPQRNCKIKLGSAEKPDSCRGGDYSLVHLSEVGLWKATEGKKPEDIVRSACSGILYKPHTMIVYESTANGTGNFFQREYDAAKQGTSQFHPLFIPWYDIEKYTVPPEDTRALAAALWEGRDNPGTATEREEPGRYLWKLWEKGATLEAINWYIIERAKYNDHGEMAAEYPSDDIEAFVHSGARVFDAYKVEALRRSCRPPIHTGDIYTTSADTGEDALRDLRFKDDPQGTLHVWALPDIDPAETVTDRYLAVVDIGGRTAKADWSVIAVFDRINLIEGDRPAVVAQWYGHTDMDLLAWKAAQIAAFYDNALLVIESNTPETRDRERTVDGDQSQYILNQIRDVYPNLYARRQSEEDIAAHAPRKYGFHTNKATKPMIISTLIKTVRENLYTERDARVLDEYLTYERKPNGTYGAIAGKHDDLLMTRAIGLHICFHEMPLPTIRPAATRRAPTSRRIISEATI